MKTSACSLILAAGLASVAFGAIPAPSPAVPTEKTTAFTTRREILDLTLSPAEAATLPESARAAYDRALMLSDRVDFGGAIDSLGEAAAAAPENVDLQFLLVKASRWRAETTYGEESVKYYDLGESAIRRLLSNPALGPSDRTRVRRESERITAGQENLRARDEARKESGFKLVSAIRQERALRSGLIEEQTNPFAIDALLEEPKAAEEETKKVSASDIWSMFAAPGYEAPKPAGAVPPGGAPGGGFVDPFAGGGGFAAQDPFATPSGDPFGAPVGGGDPFGAPPAADPFSGGGDPFGGGGK